VSQLGSDANGVVNHERVVRQRVREFEAGFFLRFVLDNYDNSPYIYDTMSYRRLNIEG